MAELQVLSSDATLAINATTTLTTSNITYGNITNAINVKIYDKARVRLEVTGGNASCSKDITFYFQVSDDGVNFNDLLQFVVTLSGTTAITTFGTIEDLDLSNVSYLRLNRASNAETGVGYTATVNAHLTFG